MVTSRRGLSGIERDKEFAISGKQRDSVREESKAVSGTTVVSVQNRHQKPLHPLDHQHQEVESGSRKKKNLRGRGPSGKTYRDVKTF